MGLGRGVWWRSRARGALVQGRWRVGEWQEGGRAGGALCLRRWWGRRGRWRAGAPAEVLAGGDALVKVKVKVGKSLHRLNFPVLTSSFRPLFDLPDAPSAVPPTSSEWVPGRPVPKPWRF